MVQILYAKSQGGFGHTWPSHEKTRLLGHINNERKNPFDISIKMTWNKLFFMKWKLKLKKQEHSRKKPPIVIVYFQIIQQNPLSNISDESKKKNKASSTDKTVETLLLLMKPIIQDTGKGLRSPVSEKHVHQADNGEYREPNCSDSPFIINSITTMIDEIYSTRHSSCTWSSFCLCLWSSCFSLFSFLIYKGIFYRSKKKKAKGHSMHL